MQYIKIIVLRFCGIMLLVKVPVKALKKAVLHLNDKDL